ncbi:unnamed protein product [Mytilus edulis]|uniref:BTB domain-containing protein n=1 Tax=Mytilus edulis TaxID=6550 RepID=A0A8S3QIM3_MYTED|nr:unnamed protein product [Mytilus edulis]
MDRSESTLALVDFEQTEFDDCSSGYGSSQDLSDSEAVTNDTVDTPDREHIGHTSRSINSILNTRMGHWTSSTSMSFRNTQTLTEHLRTISYIPQLCDVIFEVGPEKVKVHGVKAILGTRSSPEQYQPEDFRKIIEFIHCGSVEINSSCLAGLLCGASQFGLDDLEKACWDFVNYCVKNGNVLSLLPSAKRYSNFKLGQILMEKIFCSVRRTVTV